MLNPKLIQSLFTAASIQRWNDYPRMVELVELDKQAHKFIIAYLFAKIEIDNGSDIDMVALIEAGMFEFLRRVVVTDIRPDVFRVMLHKKSKELNGWVLSQLDELIDDVDDGEFYKRFEQYLQDENMYKKERFIHKAASYISTKWEFSIIYQTSQFLNDIDEVKKAVEDEIEDYHELLGVRKSALGKKLSRFIDLSGRLRFQKRWAQTPRVPETSVLGHMLIVAVFSYFYSISIKACSKRLENNFFCALFHDLPEALTRDIITPVKYSVSGMDDIISEYEILKIQDDILPLIPYSLRGEFSYLLGLYDGKKDEFLNKIYQKNIKVVDTLNTYNEDRYNAIDGTALKACDRLAAFVEATLSISHGVKSKELINGASQTLSKIKENGIINGVDFYKLAVSFEKSLS
jgi:putative hydrolase of HD superfamily